jgi:hypothetical protein
MTEGPGHWAFWTGVGIIGYSIAVTIHSVFFYRRIFGAASKEAAG